MSISNDIASLIRQFEERIKQVETIASPLNEEQFRWRPEPDRWSICENIMHLALSPGDYYPIIARAAEKARIGGYGLKGTFTKGTIRAQLFIKMLAQPIRIRSKTVKSLVPGEPRGKKEVLNDFRESQTRLIELLRDFDGVDLGKAMMNSPYVNFLRMTVAQAFEVLLVHNDRHIWHMQQIVNHREFPHAESHIS